MKILRWIAVLATVSGSALHAQTAKLPAWDVISVKVNKSGTNMMRSQYTPVGLNAMNVTMTMLIRQAYGLYSSNDELIGGLPGWAKSERFDIQAKVAPEDLPAYKALPREKQADMVQALLAERFKLVAHREVKEMSVYALVVAKGGLKMKEAKPADSSANGMPGAEGKPAGSMVQMGRGHMEAQSIPMNVLLSSLTQYTGRTVIDKTGLTGKYDVTLDWTPDEPDGTTAAGFTPLSIFTAVQEQLGLKLESQKGSVDAVVVDHLEEPVAD